MCKLFLRLTFLFCLAFFSNYIHSQNTWDGSSSTDWNTAANWSDDAVPISSTDVIIADVTNQPVISSTVSITSLTVNSSADFTISSGSLAVSGATDINGTVNIAASTTMDTEGTFDANSGYITFTGAGTLKVSGAVNSFGTMTTSAGTVVYDGGTQTVISDDYYNLEIDQSGTKTPGGNLTINGNLILTNGELDFNGNKNINVKGDITKSSGALVNSSSSNGYLILKGTSGTQTVAGFTGASISIKVTNGANVTVNGDITANYLWLQSSNTGIFLIDGDVVAMDDKIVVDGGTLKITSGSLTTTSNSSSAHKLDGGTLDIDGGIVNIGNNTMTTADLNMDGGTIDISGGTLNITDELDVVNGTITQSGGTINIKYNTGANGSSAHKFNMVAGTLNLTAGTMNVNGEANNVDWHSVSLNDLVSVNANSNHTIAIIDNTSGSSAEHRYINLGTNSIGSLIFNVSSKDLFLKSNSTLLGDLTITNGELRSQEYNIDVTGDADIDDEIEISTGTVNIDGAFDATNGTIDFTDAGRLQLAGSVTSLGTLDAAAGTIEYDGGTQNVLVDDYNNLEIDQSGSKTAQGTITVAGTLTVQNDATFAISATTTTVAGSSDINGAITASTGILDANGAFDATGGSITFSDAGTLRILGAVTSLGNLGTSNGTIEYDGADQTIFSDTYNNLLLSGSGIPAAGGNIICNGTFTLQNSNTKYNLSSHTHQTIGATDLNENIEISTGTYDADGSFDAASQTIDFTGAGRLQLAGSVTSLGSLDVAAGTVEYDGGTQTVLAGTYYSLEIDETGIKTTDGTVSTEGDITISGGTLELAGNSLYCAGNFSNSATLSSASTTTFYFDGNSTSTNVGGFNDADINFRKTGSSDLTTTGDITCRGFLLHTNCSGSFIIDGEDIVVNDYCSLTSGTLQITSGTLSATKNTESTSEYSGFNLSNGTLDIDGGTVSFGTTSTSDADLNINGGTLDVSGGTLNVSDCIDVVDGTLTQSGGTINIRNYNGTGNTSEHKLEIAAGTLNLTAGTMNINGESSNTSYYSTSVASGVTVNANANHTIALIDNTSGSSTENRNVSMGGTNSIGSLSFNVSSKNLNFVGNQSILGLLSIVNGTVKSDDASEKITTASIAQSGGFINISDGEIECTGKADIDGKLTMTGGTFDLNGELEFSSSTTEAVSAGAITVAGDFDGANGNNFTPTGGTITLDGSAADAGLSLHSTANFYDLLINNGSYDVDASSNINVENDFTISAGELDLGSYQINIKGDISGSGILSSTGSSVFTMNGSSAQTLSTAMNLSNLTITNTSGVTANANVTLTGDLILNSSCTYSIGTTTTVVGGASDINGTLTMSTGNYDANGTFDASTGYVTFTGAGTLNLAGNVTSLGTFTSTTGSKVHYDGTSAQTIVAASAKSAAYEDLEISGSDKTLTGTTTVNDDLIFSSNHDIITNGNTIELTKTPTGTNIESDFDNPTDTRVIVGGSSSTVTVKYKTSGDTQCLVPIGIDGSSRPIGITPASENSSAVTYTVVYTPGTPYNGGVLNWGWGLPAGTGSPIQSGVGVAHVNNHYYYDISRSAAVNASLQMGFEGLTEPTDANKYILHWSSGNNQWEKETGSISTTTGQVLVADVSSFSPFTQGSGGDPLPIDLVSFNGECQKNEVELEFVVASQINNDYFTIERSTNNKDWTTVAEIAGVGNTSTQMSYDWIDLNPLSGTSYYQLTQTDFDGKSETFAPIIVTCEDDAIGGYTAYPNPATNELMIDLELDSYQGDNIKVQLVDINGRIVKQQTVTMERGINHVELSIKEVPNGIYLLQFSGTNSHIKETRIVKN